MIPTLFISNISFQCDIHNHKHIQKKRWNQSSIGSYHFDYKSISTLNKNNCSAKVTIDIPIAIGHFHIL